MYMQTKRGIGAYAATLFMVMGILLPLHATHAWFDTALCPLSVELIKNGSFETPVVNNPATWDIFSSGPQLGGWEAAWKSSTATFDGETRPAVANLELQSAVHNGWGYPFGGKQYAELDTDWPGPSAPSKPYPSSINLYQTIPTIPGNTYKLSFAFSPRPDDLDVTDNGVVVSWGGKIVDTIMATSVNPTMTTWSVHTYNLVATSSNTRVNFADAGRPNGVGTFIDAVSVTCAHEPEEGGVGGGEDRGSASSTPATSTPVTAGSTGGATATPIIPVPIASPIVSGGGSGSTSPLPGIVSGGGGTISSPLPTGSGSASTSSGGGAPTGTPAATPGSGTLQPGEVLGDSTEDAPGTPDTGAGGDTAMNFMILSVSALITVAGISSLAYNYKK